MSSLAQEESRSISENVTWGHRKRFADGKVTFAYSRFLGLDKAADGSLVVNEEEAKTVRLIFSLFLNGLTPFSIAREMTRRGIKTPTGKKEWWSQTVKRILQNEKYKGDVLLQKEYTEDFLTKKRKINKGEVPQFYVQNNHPAIISPQVFDMVQAEIGQRNGQVQRYSGISIFSNKIKCGECGGWYGSKVWHSNDKYRRVIYRCNRKYDVGKCQTPHLTEEEIKMAFVSAFNQLFSEKSEVIANAEEMKRTFCDTSELEKKKAALTEEKAVLGKLVQEIVDENARVAQSQDDYAKRYNSMLEKYEDLEKRLDGVEKEIADKGKRSAVLATFIKTLKAQDCAIKEFDGHLWGSMVDFLTVGRSKEIIVTFKDGTKINA